MPQPSIVPTEALKQLLVCRREDQLATCCQHMEQHRRHFYKLSLVGQGRSTFFLTNDGLRYD